MTERCNDSGEQIKQNEFTMTESPFNIIAENPQIQHVAGKMKETAMNKKRCKKRGDETNNAMIE